jgi:photosystem II stability/assembly factor-like uncharacterized protein
MHAQSWLDAFNTDSTTNFYTIQSAFYRHWADKTPDRGEGWKIFKRWEWYWEHRIHADGSFPPAGQKEKAWKEYLAKNPKPADAENNNPWISLGPSVSNPGYTGIGRINALAFHPNDPNIFWAGTPAGGLWKTTTGGNNWEPLTDHLTSTGVSAIALHPKNPDILYIGTGDGDSFDSYSTGVLKSTDGGRTFGTTGLTWTLSQSRVIRALLINPQHPDTMLVAASNGIYYTNNGGSTWLQRVSGNGASSHDLEFKPGDPDIVYAATTDKVRRSTDGGYTWTVVMTVPSCNRIALAVSPANPNMVVALCSSSANGSFKGFYVSYNSGASFSLRSSTPNILGSRADGTSATGQGGYDLAVAISPTDSNLIYTGGINIWRSTDGGVTWKTASNWFNTANLPTVHADQHTFVYRENTLFIGCDGGVYSTITGNSYTYHSSNMAISQIYRVSSSQVNNAALIGLQDNGTKFLNANATWSDETGGDGMQCHIDPGNAQIMYSSTQNGGTIYRSVNGGGSWSSISAPLPDTGSWITPYIIDPSNPARIYAGYRDVWRSDNRGNTWTKLSAQFSTSFLRYLGMSAVPSNVLYAATTSNVWRSDNGGITFKTITNGIPTTSVTRLAVHPADSHTVYLTYGGFSGIKVVKSTDGGQNWINFSGNLPSLPVNCAVVDADGTVYVGMDIGIYYRTASSNSWVLYNEALPNAPVMDMTIHLQNRKLRAATYGRGLWENDLLPLQPCPAPVLTAAGSTEICPGQTLTLRATQVCSGCVVTWPTQETGPTIAIQTPGTYSVTVTGGCTTASVSNEVIVTEKFYQPIIDTTGCVFTAPEGTQYQWFLDTIALLNDTSRTYIPVQGGQYTVQMTNMEGCTGISAPVRFGCLVNVDHALLSAVRLVPNPNNGRFQIRLPGATANLVALSDATGRLLHRWDTPADNQIFEAGTLSPGIYVVTVWQKGVAKRLKCVVTK